MYLGYMISVRLLKKIKGWEPCFIVQLKYNLVIPWVAIALTCEQNYFYVPIKQNFLRTFTWKKKERKKKLAVAI